MDQTTAGLIGAGIVAGGSIIGNIILALFLAQEKKKKNNVLRGTDKALEVVRSGCGYGAKYVKSTAKIEDLEGTTHVTREYHRVGVITQGIKLSAFPEEVKIVAPGTINTKPQLLPSLEKAKFRKAIELVPEQFGDQTCKFRIEIAGGLMKADGEINYGFEWTCSRAVCMTKEEAAETYASDLFKKEYFGFDVRFPIDKAEIEIEFPKGYNVRAFPGVFLAGSEIWHDLELQRIKKGIEPTSRGARLKIKDPRIGYRYLIFWEPLSEREVRAIKVTT